MLLDCAKLSRATGFSWPYISAIKAQPDSPFSGRYSTVEKVEAWIVAHPDFRPWHYWRAKKSQRAQERSLEARAAGRSCGRSRRHGR